MRDVPRRPGRVTERATHIDGPKFPAAPSQGDRRNTHTSMQASVADQTADADLTPRSDPMVPSDTSRRRWCTISIF